VAQVRGVLPTIQKNGKMFASGVDEGTGLSAIIQVKHVFEINLVEPGRLWSSNLPAGNDRPRVATAILQFDLALGG
jgi:hypothetical protein